MSRATRTPETTDSRNERDHSPEAKLWRVVLQLAISDAFAKPDTDGTLFRKSVEARDWLTEGGRDLRDVCEFAGIEAGMVNAWALEMERDRWPLHRFEEWKQTARGRENKRIAA